MPSRVYLAIDLGAESGRVIAGLWNGKTIRLEEIHRFPNGPVYLGDSLRWGKKRGKESESSTEKPPRKPSTSPPERRGATQPTISPRS